jgi:hypothetical protein
LRFYLLRGTTITNPAGSTARFVFGANCRRLNEWLPLKFYLNVTNAKKAKHVVRFEVRYLGQTVAELTSGTDGVSLSTKGYAATNERDFDCDIVLNNMPWAGSDATKFRAHFKSRPDTDNVDGVGEVLHNDDELGETLGFEYINNLIKCLLLLYNNGVRCFLCQFPSPTRSRPLRMNTRAF